VARNWTLPIWFGLRYGKASPKGSFKIMTSELAIVGLGKMGANMARRLAGANIKLTVFDQDAKTTEALAVELGCHSAHSLSDLVRNFKGARSLWLMLPSGEITENTIQSLKSLLQSGDTVIDGGNSFYKDSQRRASELAQNEINFIDVGVSGGVWGLKNGYALMIGGLKPVVESHFPVFKALAPSPTEGWIHCGPNGSGHFVKMVHNGIEYGMMQAYAEGLSLIHNKTEFGIDLSGVTEMWRHGSVVRSWLLDLIADFLAKGTDLESIAPFVPDSGEGRWTAMEGIEQGIPTPVISTSLMARFASQNKDDFSARLLSMMRNGFGGHAVKKN
jgi:6-phosphogluconate dehydrogenase